MSYERHQKVSVQITWLAASARSKQAAESAAELAARVSSRSQEQATAAVRARSRQPAYQNPHQQLSSTTAIVNTDKLVLSSGARHRGQRTGTGDSVSDRYTEEKQT